MRLQGSKSDVTFLLVLLAISLGFNVYLAGLVFKQQPAPVELLARGDKVPPIAAKTLAGRAQRIEYSAAEMPSVLYVFSPDCPWCLRNVDNVKHLVAATQDRFRFVGISTRVEGLVPYLEETGLELPVYSVAADKDAPAFLMAGVPQTLVVSADGEVLQSWRGAYAAGIQEEVEDFFGVELPGLAEDTESAGALLGSVARTSPTT